MALDKESFNCALFEWYSKSGRVLPWQKEHDPYRIFVAVVMLQQTQVATMIPYYQRFISVLPTIKDLAETSDEMLLKLWEGLGYYSRARNLKSAAQIIMKEQGGIFPKDYDTLIRLPGIGDYSAGAILSIAFQAPFEAIDGNLYRIFSRILGIERPINDPVLRRQVSTWVKQLLPKDRPGDFNQALMDLGATICTANTAPACACCPFMAGCMAHQKGIEKDIPKRKAKALKKAETRTVFVILNDGKLALRKRDAEGLLGGMWEFPNREGELTFEAAKMQLAAWKITPTSIRKLPSLFHHFSHITWKLIGLKVIASFHAPETGFTWVSRETLQQTMSLPKAFSILLKAMDDSDSMEAKSVKEILTTLT